MTLTDASRAGHRVLLTIPPELGDHPPTGATIVSTARVYLPAHNSLITTARGLPWPTHPRFRSTATGRPRPRRRRNAFQRRSRTRLLRPNPAPSRAPDPRRARAANESRCRPGTSHTLVGMLAQQAIMGLGIMADRKTGGVIVDLEGSRFSIDLLEVLQQKNQGKPCGRRVQGTRADPERPASAIRANRDTRLAADGQAGPRRRRSRSRIGHAQGRANHHRVITSASANTGSR